VKEDIQMTTFNFYIVYISPNGSTAQVADGLAAQLEEVGTWVDRIDLAGPANYNALVAKLNSDPRACLLIGSPVYRDMAVPPVMAFIDALGSTKTGWAVPFVTWGLACSGVALWQMGGALEAKGYRLAGAARVAALHSNMWLADDPVGEGHPDVADKQHVRDLVDYLLAEGGNGTYAALSLEALDYQPVDQAAESKAKLDQPWMVIPKTVNEENCTQCGECAETCPMAAVSLNPYPVFGTACFDCFTCVRVCPEEAIDPKVPMSKIEEMIRNRAVIIKERPLTEIYYGNSTYWRPEF
jgi:ferredoxin